MHSSMVDSKLTLSAQLQYHTRQYAPWPWRQGLCGARHLDALQVRFSAGPHWAGSYMQLTQRCLSTTSIKLSISTLHDSWDQYLSIAETQLALFVSVYLGRQVPACQRRSAWLDSAKRWAQQQTRLVGHIAPPVMMSLEHRCWTQH